MGYRLDASTTGGSEAERRHWKFYDLSAMLNVRLRRIRLVGCGPANTHPDGSDLHADTDIGEVVVVVLVVTFTEVGHPSPGHQAKYQPF